MPVDTGLATASQGHAAGMSRPFLGIRWLYRNHSRSLNAPAMAVSFIQLRSRVRIAAIIFAVATGLAIFSGSQNAIYRIYQNQPADWVHGISHALVDWYAVAVFAPLVFWIVRRRPIDATNWRTRLPVYLLLGPSLATLKDVLFLPIGVVVYDSPLPVVRQILLRTYVFDVLVFAALIGLAHAIQYARSIRERELRAAQLESRLWQARLELLRSELQPHFLFNALQGVSTLMHRDVEAADEMLNLLSELLRLTLDRRTAQEVPLSEELAILERYLAIIKLRFGKRLTVSVDFQPGLGEVRVPIFILQPLVENAVEHGINQQAGQGMLWINGRQDGESIRISVANTGSPFHTQSRPDGIGLANTRMRLEQLYGAAGKLEILNRESGVEVVVTVPHTPSSRAEGSA